MWRRVASGSRDRKAQPDGRRYEDPGRTQGPRALWDHRHAQRQHLVRMAGR
jgi:hypothetical protein